MLKRLLVYLYGDKSNASVIETAAAFAVQHDALLSAVFVTPDIMNYATVYGDYPLNLAQSLFDVQKSYGESARREFEKICEQHDCENQWHTDSEIDAHFSPALYADLLFVRQPKTEGSVIFNDTDFVDNLIIETGLPTIVVPDNWQQTTFGERIVLGWKQSKEAVAATRYSLGLMRLAESVHIVSVTHKHDPQQELIDGVEICAYLSAHQIKCEFFSVPLADKDKTEADTLQRHASEHGCDLIVIGGYGHTRLREIVLGGVTRNLVRSCTQPVLVAH
ncbi:MAG: universal stress protein [Gammaproteobacteria bacterium]|nr:universal stress protein [Gammaproteobacteria bacterium]